MRRKFLILRRNSLTSSLVDLPLQLCPSHEVVRFVTLNARLLTFAKFMVKSRVSCSIARPDMPFLSVCHVVILCLNEWSYSQTFSALGSAIIMDARSAMRPCYVLPPFFLIFFMAALVGQTAERIFTKLSHVVDIRCYLRTY